MSYFIGGLHSGEEPASLFQSFLVDLVPNQSVAVTARVRAGASSLDIFGRKKAIADIVVEGRAGWLVVIGTPLLRGTDTISRPDLLNAFIANPQRVLLNSLDGNFAVIAYDAEKREMLAATDYNSTIPIFYSSDSNRLLLSSHELALSRIAGSSVDPFGFAQAIQVGATWGVYTRFSGIRKLLPCQIARFRDARVELSEYWKPTDEKAFDGSLDAHIERWSPLLADSVRSFHESSGLRPVYADFTAGEDGRLLVAQCRSLGIPFTAHVSGVETDTDVIIARSAAEAAGFNLLVRQKHQASEEQLIKEGTRIALLNESYQDFFKACTEYSTEIAEPLDDYATVKYCGLPGGEAFRGSYYLRGKAFAPSLVRPLDVKFFTRLKYLLDFTPNLLRGCDEDFKNEIYKLAAAQLEQVQEFGVGTQIDHLLRMFQTGLLGLKYKNPLYLPLATAPMTKSIYWLSPSIKRGGRLTKAVTELLFPTLANVRTQNGVPTVRRTLIRQHLFLPEYKATVRKVCSGTLSRLLKWTKPNKWYYSDEWTSRVFRTLLNAEPYKKWFSSPEEMVTGSFYNSNCLESILTEARLGTSRSVPILSRIISNELALRWVAKHQP